MAWQYILSDSVGTLVRVTLGTADSAYIGAGVNVISTDNNDAINGTGSSQTVVVHGHVSGGYGVYMGGLGQTSVNVSVQAGGTVSATFGTGVTVLADDGIITNAGSIIAQSLGINLNGDRVRLTNTGTIESLSTQSFGAAITFYSSSNAAGSEATAFNYGQLIGGLIAVRGDTDFGDRFYNYGSVTGHVNQLGGDDLMVNRGTILGNAVMEAGNDRIDNRNGEISGDVFLGAGDDRYDGAGGLVTGQINGEAGADSFTTNAAAVDIVDGGADTDTVDFRLGAGVVIALDASFENDGAAAGDTYLNIERVTGSGFADVIRGSSGSNILTGNAGNDLLDGAAGSDILRGGIGTDTLTSGLGNDNFYFYTTTELGDVVTDFSASAAGNDDRFSFRAANFGAGLVVGALDPTQFQSRADNLAQDANDRFIFRTTDATLWFDADGNGAGAAVMVADLQAGAGVTAADIFLI